MRYTIERLPESRVAIDVELEPEPVEKALERAARRISQRYRIPGFRPGKAPRYVVEARYGRAALYEEAAEDLIREAYQEILDKNEFAPVGRASLESIGLEPFTFRLIVPVLPTVTLGDYRALRFSEDAPAITEEDIQTVLRTMQEEQTVWQEPDPLRVVRPGDRLLVDLVGFAGEREIERREQVEIVVGDENLLSEFSESLIGAEIGQTVEVATTLPAEIDDKELAGQTATYTVVVHGIREPEPPALDDEFARSFGQEDTLEEMRARISRELEEAARKEAREKVLEEMTRALVEQAEVDMPQALLDAEVHSMFQEQAQQLLRHQIPMTRYLDLVGKSEEEYRQELLKIASQRLRRLLVLQEFIRAEGLTGEGQELQNAVEERLLAISRGEVGQEPAATPPEASRSEQALEGEPATAEIATMESPSIGRDRDPPPTGPEEAPIDPLPARQGSEPAVPPEDSAEGMPTG